MLLSRRAVKGMLTLSLIHQSSHADQFFVPIGNFHALHADALAFAGAVDKGIVAAVNAGMQSARAGTDAEDDDIARFGLRTIYRTARAGLINGNTGHLDAVFLVCPPDQTGAVKALGRGIAAVAVFLAHLRIGGFDDLAALAGARAVAARALAAARAQREHKGQCNQGRNQGRKASHAHAEAG